MSRPRFLADHNLNDAIVSGLQERVPLADIERCRDLGLERVSDPDLLAWAAETGRIVVSHDVNTLARFAIERVDESQLMPGLFLVSAAAPVGRVIDDLVTVWSASEAEEWHGQIVWFPL
ncbi:MAG: DUF5615 family PIN-like protein [Planctomycetota bacterium]